MARTRQIPYGCDRRQSWTRCRIPVDKSLPTNLRLSTTEWPQRLCSLINSPGYERSDCGRSSADPEEVIFITNWKNEDSLQSFISSPGFSTYLQIFFGVEELSKAPPYAFFTTAPLVRLFDDNINVFTLSYAHPVGPEDRHLKYGGPLGTHRWTQLGFRNQTIWVREPQRLSNGQVVDIAMGIQLWPAGEVAERNGAMGDPFVRMEWDGEVDRITPLGIEEVTWLLKPLTNYEDDAFFQELHNNGEHASHEHDVEEVNAKEDNAEEDDDILISKQLLLEQAQVHALN